MEKCKEAIEMIMKDFIVNSIYYWELKFFKKFV